MSSVYIPTFISDLDRILNLSTCNFCMDLVIGKCIQDCEYRPDKYTGYQNDIFKKVLEELNTCGFYYRNMTPEEALKTLAELEPGSFLVRDSSFRGNYFTLTYKNRKKQIRHIRIEYCKGKFSFQSSQSSSTSYRKEETVLKLIQYYVLKSQGSRNSSSSDDETVCTQIYQDNISRITERKSKKTESSKPYLIKPVKKSIQSLQHLCRISLNEENFNPDTCPLKDYLKVYPYKL